MAKKGQKFSQNTLEERKKLLKCLEKKFILHMKSNAFVTKIQQKCNKNVMRILYYIKYKK